MLAENAFLPILLTLASYEVGRAIQRKTGNSLCNPILIGAILTASMLLLLKIPVDAYQSGCAPLQYLLTPATICYALGLYEQLEKLKKQLGAILAGILCGSIVSLLSIRAMASMFFLNDVLTISLLPKSITTAIGMVLSSEAGGIAALTTAAIVITGVLGNVFGESLCKLFRIHHPIAQGVAFGTASHAVGTSRAMELSQLTGAVSSLSLTVAGVITAVLFHFLIP